MGRYQLMSYKELVLQQQFTTLVNHQKTVKPLKNLFENHSPVIKLWFIVMLANLLLVWCMM
jgi:hypothetical protein